MTWNYRIFRHKSEYAGRENYYYGLHEVFYNDEGNPYSYAIEADAVGDDVDELVENISIMLRAARACKKGGLRGKNIRIMEEKDFEKGGRYYDFMVAQEKEWMIEIDKPLQITLHASRHNKNSSSSKSKKKPKSRL